MNRPSICHCGRFRASAALLVLVAHIVAFDVRLAASEPLPPLWRVGVGHLVGFMDAQGRIARKPDYEGAARNWRSEALWVVRRVSEECTGNFIGYDASELLPQPARQYLDEELFTTPCFWDHRAKIRLCDGRLVYTSRQGLLGEAKFWESDLFFDRVGATLVFFDGRRHEVFRLEGDEAIVGISPLVAVRNNNRWHFHDYTGRRVVPVDFDSVVADPESRTWLVRKSDRCGILGSTGTWIVPMEFDGAGTWPGHNVAVFRRDAKWGLIRTDTFEVIQDPRYDAVEFRDIKMAWALQGNQWHPIAPDGSRLLARGFDRVSWLYKDPYLWAVDTGGLAGLVNSSGEMILPCEYRSVQPSADRHVLVHARDGVGLFYAPEGRFVLQPKYDGVRYWSALGRKAVVVRPGRQDSKWGMVRMSDGKELLPPEYDRLDSWNHLIAARKDGRIALFNVEGIAVLPSNANTTALPDSSSGFVNGFGKLVCGGRAGLIGADGKIALACRYQDVGHFSEGVVPAKNDGLWGYVNLDGDWIIPPQYANAHAFLNGLAAVQRNGKYGYIDAQGRLKVPFRFVDAGYAHNDRMPVARDDGGTILWGLINTSGDVVLPLEYDCVEWVNLGPTPTQYHGQITWKVY